MKTTNLKNYTGGWVFGNFDPALINTTDFEMGIKHHVKGEYVTPHYQLTATEYNIIVSGNIIANGEALGPNDIFVYAPDEICNVEFLEDTTIVCVKSPSVGPEDKIEYK
jgi:hypothetical protein|tara:strand:- start:5405 stop:5731 length:327 start_codon:yes stop_codon:yes gene_type:complete